MKTFRTVRGVAGVAAGLTALTVGLGVQATTAYAAVTLTVSADDFDTNVHPGDRTVVTVTVIAGDTATSGPVSVTLTATGGRVTGFNDLGYPVDCTVSHGAGSCTTQGPLGSSHVVELAVIVKVNGGGSTRTATLTAVATSPADNVTGSATETIPITKAH